VAKHLEFAAEMMAPTQASIPIKHGARFRIAGAGHFPLFRRIAQISEATVCGRLGNRRERSADWLMLGTNPRDWHRIL
jgi:hypothetical protein